MKKAIKKTLGFSEVNDGGIGYWKIKKADDVDNLLTFRLNNNLMVEYILENNVQLNVKALGIKSDIDSDTVKNTNIDILKKIDFEIQEREGLLLSDR